MNTNSTIMLAAIVSFWMEVGCEPVEIDNIPFAYDYFDFASRMALVDDLESDGMVKLTDANGDEAITVEDARFVVPTSRGMFALWGPR